jgi:SAM-dependent methyltransferase
MASGNYFSHPAAAERYAKYRPYFHPVAIERLTSFTGCARFKNALDVACGTGNSTRALAEVAERVTGIDNAPAMLALTPQLSNVVYQVADAEALPFAAEAFDLVTVVMAFHWFDQGRFLREAHRVLQRDGWLLVYNNLFLGGMKGNADFKKWVGEEFLARYMTPHRSRKKLTSQFAREHGFDLAGRENVANDVVMTCEQLVGYFLSQSNVISKVEHGDEKIGDVAAWLGKGVRPFFVQPTQTMLFGSDIWYLRKRG